MTESEMDQIAARVTQAVVGAWIERIFSAASGEACAQKAPPEPR